MNQNYARLTIYLATQDFTDDNDDGGGGGGGGGDDDDDDNKDDEDDNNDEEDDKDDDKDADNDDVEVCTLEGQERCWWARAYSCKYTCVWVLVGADSSWKGVVRVVVQDLGFIILCRQMTHKRRIASFRASQTQ